MNHTTETRTAPGWCCIDCLVLAANGETNPEWDEVVTAEYLARVDLAGDWTLGRIPGQDGCAHDEADEDHAAECERQEFSWSQCDICGSSLGGAREAVTFWFA